MRYFSVFMFAVFIISAPVYANDSDRKFTLETVVEHFPVLDQGGTGTCWSFATTSFLESEIIRKGYPETDLSEMYFVYHTYKNRAFRNLLFHGHTNNSQGGQAHDVIDVLRDHGMVTQEAFPGVEDNGRHNHRNLAEEVRTLTSELNKKKDGFTIKDIDAFDAILENHLGKLPENVVDSSNTYSPVEFRDKFDIDPDDYIELTSYTHRPYYTSFVLEIPDNWAHGMYYNLPIDELVEVMYYALENGYTVAWDGDTSEKTFSHNNGIADLPKKQKGKVDQELRQETFYNRSTTDDHLMHIVGLSSDEKGERMFYTKNSWGAASNDLGGYLHMTEDYVRLKTLAILVNKDSIPGHIRQKLGLN
jgi:bleomycin hydrolase